MQKSGICAGIVSYNPDLRRLKKNIDAIFSQVDEVVVYDNGSINQKELVKIFQNKITILLSNKNEGIATALNRLMEYCAKKNILWMLSLDQDSICPYDYVKKMIPYLTIIDNLGIVAPVIIDRNIGLIGHKPKEEFAEVNTCITSGAFQNVSVWKKVGKYDESMFIDSVDFEFCYRVRKAGFKVIQVRDVQLLHELGESKKRRFLFWKITDTGHSAFRKYYIARNNIYYPLKHRLWLHFIRGNFRNIRLVFIVLLYENDKKNKIGSIIKGWKNGLKVKRK